MGKKSEMEVMDAAVRLFDDLGSPRDRLRVLRYLADKFGLTAEMGGGGGGGGGSRARRPGAVISYTSSLGTVERVDAEEFDARLDRDRGRGHRDDFGDLAGGNYEMVGDDLRLLRLRDLPRLHSVPDEPLQILLADAANLRGLAEKILQIGGGRRGLDVVVIFLGLFPDRAERLAGRRERFGDRLRDGRRRSSGLAQVRHHQRAGFDAGAEGLGGDAVLDAALAALGDPLEKARDGGNGDADRLHHPGEVGGIGLGLGGAEGLERGPERLGRRRRVVVTVADAAVAGAGRAGDAAEGHAPMVATRLDGRNAGCDKSAAYSPFRLGKASSSADRVQAT